MKTLTALQQQMCVLTVTAACWRWVVSAVLYSSTGRWELISGASSVGDGGKKDKWEFFIGTVVQDNLGEHITF